MRIEGHSFDFEGQAIPVFVIGGLRPPGDRGAWIRCSVCGCEVRFPIYAVEEPAVRGAPVCPANAPKGDE